MMDDGGRPSSVVGWVIIPPMMSTTKSKSLWLLPPLVGLVLLLPRLTLFLGVNLGFVAWPWQFDFTEGVDLDAVNLLAHGTNIYGHIGPDAFVSAPYTPLYFVVNAAITRITGPSFGPGRAMSLGATVLIALLIGYIVWMVGKGSGATDRGGPEAEDVAPVPSSKLSKLLLLACGVFAGVLWLALSPVIVWGALYTPNMPALMFGVAGIAWTLAFHRDRRVYWGIAFFLLAFYTKQSAIDAAVAASVGLLLVRFRVGLRYGLALGGSLVISFGLMNFLLDGRLWEHAFANQILPWGWGRFAVSAEKLVGEYWPLLVWCAGVLLLVPFLLARLARMSGRAEAMRALFANPLALVTIYFLVASATTATRIGRNGTNYNHLLDMLLPACAMVGVTLYMVCRFLMEKQAAGKLRWRSFAGGGLAAMCVLFVAQVLLFTPETNWYKGAWPSAQIDSQMKQLSYLVSSMQGNIYSEDTYLLLINGRPVVYDDPFMFVSLANVGKWDDSVLNDHFRQHYFSLVLLERGSGRFTGEGKQLFHDNYSILYEDIRDSYIPNPVSPAPAP
jgi:hypothetical protein